MVIERLIGAEGAQEGIQNILQYLEEDIHTTNEILPMNKNRLKQITS